MHNELLFDFVVFTTFIKCVIGDFVLQSLFERQGMTLHGTLHPGIERGHIPLPKGMSRTKSFGKMDIFLMIEDIKKITLKFAFMSCGSGANENNAV